MSDFGRRMTLPVPCQFADIASVPTECSGSCLVAPTEYSMKGFRRKIDVADSLLLFQSCFLFAEQFHAPCYLRDEYGMKAQSRNHIDVKQGLTSPPYSH